MTIQTLTDAIRYVGVDDNTLALFENHPALRKMPFTNLRLTIWTGDLFHKQTIIYRVTYNIVR